MRKRPGLALFSFMVALVFPAMHASAASITAASCSQADVQNAFNSASSGSTVLVPGPCTVSWAAPVDISSSKSIKVQASGAVTLANYGFTLEANSGAESRITGFTFTYGNNSADPGRARAILVHNSNMTVASTWRVDHNTFTESNPSITDVWVAVYGNGPGLIDHNIFTNGSAAEPIHAYGSCGPDGCGTAGTQSAWDAGWTDTIVPGSPIMVFIEDNTFNELGTASYSMCSPEAYGGAREVVRYNTFNFCYIDVHGTGYVGGRWWEIYNNNFYTPPGLNRFAVCQLRGGSGVLFNNYITGSGSSYGCQMEGEYRTYNLNNTTWPNMWQVGSGIGGSLNQHSVCGSVNTAPVQAWNNTGFSIYGVTYSWQGGQSGVIVSPSIVQKNRDFFVSTSQPSNIHWMEATGDTCATTYTYTPYTYPHPLVSGISPTPTPTPPPPPPSPTPTPSPTPSPAMSVTSVTGSSAAELLQNLAPSTAYSFSATLTGGGKSYSFSNSFTTGSSATSPAPTPSPTPTPPPPPAPSGAISVAITSPLNGSTVSGNVPVAIAASAGSPITKVILVDNNVIIATLTASPYAYAWNAAQVKNGLHYLKAVAYTATAAWNTYITVTVTGGLP